MAREQDRRALLPQSADQLLHQGRLLHAHRGCRLIEQQQPGVVGHRPRDRDQLTLPPGQGPDTAGRVPQRDAQALQEAHRIGVETGIRHQLATALAAEQQVRGDVQVVAEGQVLPDDGDAPACRRGRPRMHRPAVQRDHARGRGDVPGDAAHQGGLAGAVLTREGNQFARPHLELDAFQRRQRAEAHPQAGHRQQGQHWLFQASGGGDGHLHIVVRTTW